MSAIYLPCCVSHTSIVSFYNFYQDPTMCQAQIRHWECGSEEEKKKRQKFLPRYSTCKSGKYQGGNVKQGKPVGTAGVGRVCNFKQGGPGKASRGQGLRSTEERGTWLSGE